MRFFNTFIPGGNRWPYTNLQQMNLDWILGEMIKFIEQYTTLTETINTGKQEITAQATTELANLTNHYNELIADLNSWYSTHQNYLDATLSAKIAEFIAQADTIATQTIASIPEDYTALANKVSGIVTNLPDLIALTGYNNKNAQFMYLLNESYTQNGVTFNANMNEITITGTSTGVAVFDIFNSRTKPNVYPFIPGKRYYIIFSENDTSHGIYKQVQFKTVSDGNWTSKYSTNYNNDAIALDIPNSYYEFCVRLTCDSAGITYNKKIKFSIVPAIYDLNIMDKNTIEAIKNGRMSYNKLFTFYNSDMPNFYGVHITNADNGITLIGTANSTKTYTVLEDFNNALFKPGDRIVIDYKDPANDVYIEVVPYKNNAALTALLQTLTTGTYTVTMPADFDYIMFRLIVFNGTTYNSNVKIDIHTVDNVRRTFTVSKDGTGDFSTIKAAVEEATKYLYSTVIVKAGQYDLVAEFGETFLDNLTANYFGMVLYNGITLIFSPGAYVSFNYDGANEWIIENFSPFNTGNDIGFTIIGLNASAQNCRYLIHDDPRPGQKTRFSHNVYKDCDLTMYPSPNYANWKNHQVIGGGFSDQSLIEIDSCIFRGIFTDDVDHYSAVSYHNSSSGSAHYQSTLIIKNCVFSDKNRLTIEGYGAATEKSDVIITGNYMQNADTDIVYIDTVNNMNVYRWNNTSR